ncbi:MAG: AraC family transcriptional regulator [Alphaproteobacteria bacterium]|nr:AraC family transcriptional regulator [Alphaproteobacteria bacterium]
MTVEASGRSIQNAFRHSRGYTPTVFLRRVRLSHACNMLLQPERRTSVTDVAYACGFGNHGHFSRC